VSTLSVFTDTSLRIYLPEWVRQFVDPVRSFGDDEERVSLAIDLAMKNTNLGTGGPFGAAIFDQSGKVVAVGVNRVQPLNCSAAHAEMMAFMLAQARVQRSRLNETGERFTLATSAQPCCQCYGATFWAGVDEVLIGARSEDVEELTEFDEGPLPVDWIGELQARGIAVRRDILRAEARAVFLRHRELGGSLY